jgi:hypothetical protein
MTKGRAEQIIVISLAVLLASTIGAELAAKKKQDPEKHYSNKLVGGFLVIFADSIVAEFIPEVGAYLAIAVASYAFIHDGLPAISGHYKQATPTAKKASNQNVPGTEFV